MAESSDLVGEHDLGRVKGVGRVLRHLRLRDRDQVQRSVEVGVELGRRARALLVDPADERVRRVVEVVDSRALAQELRVVRQPQIIAAGALRLLLERGSDQREGRPGQQRAADDDGVGLVATLQRAADLARHLLDVARVQAPVAPAGRSDADQRELGGGDRARVVSSGVEPAGVDRFADQLLEARLDDRAPARGDLGVLVLVEVHADDVVPEARQAGGADRADVPQSEDGDAHRPSYRSRP